MSKTTFIFVLVVLLMATGCQGLGANADESPPELSEIHVMTGFGFSIAYPEGWLAETKDTLTAISQLEEDHSRFFQGDFPVDGLEVELDHRDMNFMTRIGLSEDATLEDLLAFNSEEFDWNDVDVAETEVFGVPALNASYSSDIGYGLSYMGFVNGEVFLFTVKAPSEESLDAFLPTWDKMLESIEPVEE